MAVVKSGQITDLDATPPVRDTAGSGGSGRIVNVGGYVTIPNASTAGDTYLMVRVPSNAIPKHLWFGLDASGTTLALDVGVYYAEAPYASPAVAGTALDADLFASNYVAATVAKTVDLLGGGATGSEFFSQDRFTPLWQSANRTDGTALTADPGGHFDVVISPHSAVTTNATVTLWLDMDYVMGG